MYMTLFNIVFTGLPPFAIGLFEQDVPMRLVRYSSSLSFAIRLC
jgi:hypothetical protein